VAEPLSTGARETLEQIFAPAFEAMRAGLDQGFHAVGEENVSIFLQGKYREFIYPIDMPGVPNLIEPALDEAIVMVIPKGVAAAHKLVHRDPAPPATP
jgi:hypothetical protein